MDLSTVVVMQVICEEFVSYHLYYTWVVFKYCEYRFFNRRI